MSSKKPSEREKSFRIDDLLHSNGEENSKRHSSSESESTPMSVKERKSEADFSNGTLKEKLQSGDYFPVPRSDRVAGSALSNFAATAFAAGFPRVLPGREGPIQFPTNPLTHQNFPCNGTPSILPYFHYIQPPTMDGAMWYGHYPPVSHFDAARPELMDSANLFNRVPYGAGVSTSRFFHPFILNENKRKGGQIRFSNSQTTQLEKAFIEHKYQNAHDRKKLAHSLGLSDRQVKTWFQNRRAKWRKGERKSGEQSEGVFEKLQ